MDNTLSVTMLPPEEPDYTTPTGEPGFTLPTVEVTPTASPPQERSPGALTTGGALDGMTQARIAGYNWPEIDNHLASFRSNAAAAGYTDREIDDHLGYEDPQHTTDVLDALAHNNLANNTTDHPITAASGGVYDPAAKDGLVTGGSMDAITRGLYSQGLLGASIKGPQDFVEAFKQSALNASGDPSTSDAADLAAPTLAASLPDNRQLTDYAIGLGQHMGLDLDLDTVNTIRANMMSAWTETGLPLSEIYQQAANNPAAGVAMVQSPLTTFGELPGKVHLNPDLPTRDVTRPFGPGEYMDNPDGSWSNEMTNTVELSPGKWANVPGLWLQNGKPVHVGEDQSAELAQASGLHFQTYGSEAEAVKASDEREVAWQTANRTDLGTKVPALWTGAIRDPHTVPRMIPSDAVVDPLPNPIDIGMNFAKAFNVFNQIKGLAHTYTAEDEHFARVDAMTQAKMPDGSPRFSEDQINAERMESPLLKEIAGVLAFGAVGKIGGATYGALASSDMAATLKALVKDESGGGVPYSTAPDNLMGFRKSGENKGFDQSNYKHIQWVEVAFHNPEQVFVDAIKGLNQAHALERARRNWEGADISPLPAQEAEARYAQEEGNPLYSGNFLATLKALVKDESGALKLTPGVILGNNLVRQGMNAAERAAWIASKPREYGEAIMREGMGQTQREWEMAAAAMEQFVKQLNQYVPEFRRELAGPRGGNFNPITGQYTPRSTIRNLMDNIEGVQGPGVVPIARGSALGPVIDAIKKLETNAWDAIDLRVQAGTIDPVGFIRDHFAHMWERPDEAIRVFGGGRQGTGRYLLGRSIPTMGDGIDAGLTPKLLNPVESELLYWRGQIDYLNAADIRALAYKDGVISYGRQLAPDYAYLKGRGSLRAFVTQNGKQITIRAQAPKQFASAYNAWVGRGVYDWPSVHVGNVEINPGRVYDKLQMAANMSTGLKLAVSTYHYKAIAQEQLAAGLTLAAGQLAHGELVGALKEMGYTATVLPKLADSHVLGRMGQRQYLGLQDYGPEMETVVDLLTRANFRFTGRRHFGSIGAAGTDVSQIGPMNNLFTAFRKGSILLEQSAAIDKLGGPAGEHMAKTVAMFPLRTVGLAAKEFSMALDTIAHPLFDYLIPLQKNAAAMNEMAKYLRDHPYSTIEDNVRAARKIADSIDNRFGELNQDNLFWPRALKQLFGLGTVSIGWELGTLRAFGAIKPALTGLAKVFVGKSPIEWGTATRWLIGFPLTMALTNAIAQWVTSPIPVGAGGPAELVKDLFIGGRTGGRNPDGTPERRLLPGYQKEFFDWAYDYAHADNLLEAAGLYAKGKANPLVQFGQAPITGKEYFNWHNWYNPRKADTATQEDWHNGLVSHFFTKQGTVAPQWLQLLRLAERDFNPIAFQNQPKPGSAIGWWGRLLGDKPVPHYIIHDVAPTGSSGRGHSWKKTYGPGQ